MEAEVIGQEAPSDGDDEVTNWRVMGRATLIERYLPLVRQVVSRMPRPGVTVSLGVEDLVGYGTIGLIEAIDRYEPGRGIKFPGYAVHRIRGAVIDAIRVLDPLPRSLRHRVKQLDRAGSELGASLGRGPTRGELCEATGLTDSQYRDTIATVERIAFPLAGAPRPDDPEGSFGFSEPAIPEEEDFTKLIEDRETVQELGAAIEKLPDRERLVIALYYKEGLRLREIGVVLGVSETRVSQLRARAVERLRARLRPRLDCERAA